MKLELFRKIVADQIDEFEKVCDVDKFKPDETGAQIQKYEEILRQVLVRNDSEIVHEIAYYLYQRSVYCSLLKKFVKTHNEVVVPHLNNAYTNMSALKDANQYLSSNITKTVLDRKKGAKTKLENDPKQTALKAIEQEYKDSNYTFHKRGYKTKFAKEMLAKYPLIESIKTIERLVTKLSKNTPSAS